ncbi:MAG: hypothetical protein WC661_02075 [Opitutaceae bacterium]
MSEPLDSADHKNITVIKDAGKSVRHDLQILDLLYHCRLQQFHRTHTQRFGQGYYFKIKNRSLLIFNFTQRGPIQLKAAQSKTRGKIIQSNLWTNRPPNTPEVGTN